MQKIPLTQVSETFKDYLEKDTTETTAMEPGTKHTYSVAPYGMIEHQITAIKAFASPDALEGRHWGMLEKDREFLRVLAVYCGYPHAVVKELTGRNLIDIYKVAVRNPLTAVEVVAKMRAELYGDALKDLPPPPVTEPVTTPDNVVTKDYLERIMRGHVVTVEEAMQRHATDINGQLSGMVSKAVADALAAQTPTRLEIVIPGKPPVVTGLVHRQTPRVIRALAAGMNVYCHGPAGSGKTTLAMKVGEAFLLDVYTAAKVESEYMLLGYRDARGEVVRTPFREAYEHGGVFLFDELDASSPSAIVALNMALANGVCPFPDGLVKRHENFKCIAAGNTKLSGATRAYAGRMQMDAASIDRFYFIEFGYDEVLEMELASNKAWCKHVQAMRKAVEERGLTHLITPRATLDGCKALAMGDTWEEAEDAVIFKGLDADTVDQLRRACKDTRKPMPKDILSN